MKRPIIVGGTLLAVALGGVTAWQYWPIRNHFWTDADAIRQPTANAPLRDILWQPARRLETIVNTDRDEYEPKLSADGLTLFYVRGKAGKNADIVLSRQTYKGWTEAQPLDAVNSPDDDLGPSPSADGESLYFYSNRVGGLGGYDLWRSRLTDEGWQTPTNLGPAVNSEFNDYGPAPTPDGTLLYFSSNRPQPSDAQTPSPDAWPATLREDLFHRSYDLYAAPVTPTGFSKAQPQNQLNTPFNEGAPVVSPFGDFLYFASDRPGGMGGFDLYRSRRLHGAYQPPINLGDAVNSSHNDLDPATSLGGYGLSFSSDRPRDEAAASALRDYDLYYTTSREVYREVEESFRPPIDWAAIWRSVGPNLLWALLALLFLLLMLSMFRAARDRKLGLMIKCLLASLVAHLLLMLLFNVWQVATSLAGEFAKGARGPIQIALAPTGAHQALAGQIRGPVTNIETPPAPAPAEVRAAAAVTTAPEPRMVRLAQRPPSEISVQLPPERFSVRDATVSSAAPPSILQAPEIPAPSLSPQLAVLETPAPTRVDERPLEVSPPTLIPSPRAATAALTLEESSFTPTNVTIPSARVRLDDRTLAATSPPSDAPPERLATLQRPHPATSPLFGEIPPAAPAVIRQPSDGPLIPSPSATEASLDPPVPTLPSPRAGVETKVELRYAPVLAELNVPSREIAVPFEDQSVASRLSTKDSSVPAVRSHTPEGAVKVPSIPTVSNGDLLELPKASAPVAASESVTESIDGTTAGVRPPIPAPAMGNSTRAPSTDTTRLPNRTIAPGPVVTLASFDTRIDERTPRNRVGGILTFLPIDVRSDRPTMELSLPLDEQPPENPYQQRFVEDKAKLVEQMGGNARTEEAVAKALQWLAAHQSADGHWDANHFDDRCGYCGGQTRVDADRALTGLSLLCFLGAGHTHQTDGPYQDAVERGLSWLLSRQAPDGDLRGDETMYSHGIAAIALSEAFAMTGDSPFREPVERAVSFIVRAQNKNVGGWRYEPGQAGDTSVLGWQVMALKSAANAGVRVPPSAFEAAATWLNRVSERRNPGLYGYQPGREPMPSMTAEGLFVQELLGLHPSHPRNQESVAFVLEHLPQWGSSEQSTYFWYYASLALFQHQGDEWKKWNEAVRDQLTSNQRQDGRATGSWDPLGEWADIGGRVYQTALCTLMLEVYYRYLPLFRMDPAVADFVEPRDVLGTLRGTVTDATTHSPLARAVVRLDLPDRSSVTATTEPDGSYLLNAPDVPEFFALSSSHQGFVPKSMNVERARLAGRTVIVDFALEKASSAVLVTEPVPDVHHLGDDRFDGTINSQFQNRSEGSVFTVQFELHEQQLPPRFNRAEVRLLAKGVQRSHRIVVNGNTLTRRLNRAPQNGSFGEFAAPFDPSILAAGSNTLQILAAPSADDIDDFEFVNVQVRLAP